MGGELHPAGGIEIDGLGADFHACGIALGIAGDELALAVAAHRAEVLASGGIESPELFHGPLDFIAKG